MGTGHWSPRAMEAQSPVDTRSVVSTVKSEIFPLLGLTDTLPGVFRGEWSGTGDLLEKRSPIDGSLLARVKQAGPEDYERAVCGAQRAFFRWRTVPAPQRRELVRSVGLFLWKPARSSRKAKEKCRR